MNSHLFTSTSLTKQINLFQAIELKKEKKIPKISLKIKRK